MTTSTKSETAAKKDVTKLQRAIVDGLEDVKAQDIQVFNTEHLSPLFERVIVASGTSNRQTKALASSVRDAVKEAGFPKPRIEGEDNGEWIIVDCGAAVVHVMQPAIRQYYRLEEIWGGKPVPGVGWVFVPRVPVKGPVLLVANEFLDALPVIQMVRLEDGWHERVIELDPAGHFTFGTAADAVPRFEQLLPVRLRNASIGALYEWRSDRFALELGRRIARDGGAALLIDYGHTRSGLGETLQAVDGHGYADPLAAPGSVDLTAHVDFEALTHAVECMGARSHGPLTQGEFLNRLGIDVRAATLKASVDAQAARDIDAALMRLTGAGRTDMGELFKVIAFSHRSLATLPGFEPPA